jgi:K+-sensing histidine kinase KdpD
MGGAGILFPERNHALIAETLGRVVHDTPFRAAVLAKQRQRLNAYLSRDLSHELRTALAPVLR